MRTRVLQEKLREMQNGVEPYLAALMQKNFTGKESGHPIHVSSLPRIHREVVITRFYGKMQRNIKDRIILIKSIFMFICRTLQPRKELPSGG